MPAEPLSLIRPDRSAHASIRGYLYQTCVGVLRWLDLQENEVLLLEGDEDLDRRLRGSRSGKREQVKAYGDKVSIRNLIEVLADFAISFSTLRRDGWESRFILTTTAGLKRQQTADIGIDVLRNWSQPKHRKKVVAAVRKLLGAHRARAGEDLQEAIGWLDEEKGRWAEFVGSVDRRLEQKDLEAGSIPTGSSAQSSRGWRTTWAAG